MARMLLIAFGLISSACSPVTPPAADAAPADPPPSAPAAGCMAAIQYFVGSWVARAENPSTGEKFTLRYRVERALGGSWLAGSGESPELGLEVQDRWGCDPVTQEIVRVIFDSQGTFAMIKSRGWDRDTLVLEGHARAKPGEFPVRETITRLGPAEFKAVWESKSEETWTPYSVEHLTRDSQ